MSRVIVMGSINMDLVAHVEHLPAPGETISGQSLEYFPGGKGANQAIAAAQAGARVDMVGALGNDTFALTLKSFLAEKNVDTSSITNSETSSGTALINVDGLGENSIVVIPGANATLTPDMVRSIALEPTDTVVCQLEIPLETVTAAFRHAQHNSARTILNPAPMMTLPRELCEATSVIILNETELSLLSDTSISEHSSSDDIISATRKLNDQGFSGLCLITLGKNGCISYDFTTQDFHKYAAYSTTAVDTTGAGDCFVGVFAANIARGEELTRSITHAVCASSLCVERHGAGPSMPTQEAIRQRLATYQELVG